MSIWNPQGDVCLLTKIPIFEKLEYLFALKSLMTRMINCFIGRLFSFISSSFTLQGSRQITCFRLTLTSASSCQTNQHHHLLLHIQKPFLFFLSPACQLHVQRSPTSVFTIPLLHMSKPSQSDLLLCTSGCHSLFLVQSHPQRNSWTLSPISWSALVKCDHQHMTNWSFLLTWFQSRFLLHTRSNHLSWINSKWIHVSEKWLIKLTFK